MGLGKDARKTRRETFKLGDLVRLILEILRSDMLLLSQALVFQRGTGELRVLVGECILCKTMIIIVYPRCNIM